MRRVDFPRVDGLSTDTSDLGRPKRHRSHGTETERSDWPDMQGTFLLSHLLTRVAFKLDGSNLFIVASCVIELGLEVEAFR